MSHNMSMAINNYKLIPYSTLQDRGLTTIKLEWLLLFTILLRDPVVPKTVFAWVIARNRSKVHLACN